MLSCNSIKCSSAFVRNDSSINLESISFFVLFDQSYLFELLKSPSNDLCACMIMVFRSTASTLESSVKMRQESNSSSRAKIDLSCEGCNTMINPIIIKRSEFASYVILIILVAVLTTSAQEGR